MAGFSHVGLTVRNLERSIAFYREVVGLKEGNRLELKSEVYRTYTRNPAAHIKFTYMTSGEFTLQLIEYVGGGGEALNLSHNRVGCPHLAFRVPDAEATMKQIQQREDGEVISEMVQLSPRSRNFYAKDPDGILIEFSQLLDSRR